MRKNKLSLRRLFSNTKFLIVFSLLCAFVFWIAVALEYAPIIERTFENVPISINLENSVPEKFGLTMFGNKDFTVDVAVRGSRYIIGGDLLNPDDFDVSVQTAYVNSTGNHTLKLSVTPKNPEAEYEIIGFSPEYIEVYFDKYEEKELKVEPKIVTELEKITDDNYIFNEDEIILSQKTVKIYGAKTEVDKVEKAYAEIEIDGKLTKNYSLDAPIVLDNGTDEEVKYVVAKAGGRGTIPTTLPVYKIEALTAAVDFKNIPSEYIDKPLKCTFSPSNYRAAVMQNGEVGTNGITIGTIDFSKISDKNNSFTFNAKDIKNLKILDGTSFFKVTVDTSSIKSRTVSPMQATVNFIRNDGSSFDYDLSKLGNITVVGKGSSLSEITEKDIVVTVDTAELKQGASQGTVPVTVALKNVDDCWVYGTYSMNIYKK